MFARHIINLENTQHIRDLLSNLADGDYFAFTKFYDLYYTKVFRFARYFSHSDDTCKEVVSDVFFGIWSNRKNLINIVNLDNYLYMSIRNQIIRHRKTLKKFDFDSLDEISTDQIVEVESPENLVITDELRKLIESSIQSLPPKCKTVFLLIREEGMKYREVAELLSISERTVQNHMITAVKKILETIRSVLPEADAHNAFQLFLIFFKKK